MGMFDGNNNSAAFDWNSAYGQSTGANGFPTTFNANSSPMFSNDISWSQGQGSNPFISGSNPQTMAAPAAAGGGNGFMGWLGKDGNLGTTIGGLGTLAQAYLGWQQMGVAKDALKLQKEAFNSNLNNSIKTYNNSLEDRIRGRTSDYAGKEGDVTAYLSSHQLKR